MKKLKSKPIILIIVTVCLLSATIITIISLRPSDKYMACENKNDLIILNENNPTDIMLLGEDVDFCEHAVYRKISSINQENITSDKKYKFNLLVINDRNGKLIISDNEWLLCQKAANENGLNIFYFGVQYLQKMKELGMTSDISSSSGSVEMGAAYYQTRIPGVMSYATGFWTDTEEEYIKNIDGLQAQIILTTMTHIIREVG